MHREDEVGERGGLLGGHVIGARRARLAVVAEERQQHVGGVVERGHVEGERGPLCDAGGRERAQAGDPGGSLLVTSSTSAIDGAPANEAYSSSKTAVLGLIRGLAVEYARYGIRANAVLPGWIETDMTANATSNAKFVQNVMPRIPMRRWGAGSDFGGIAVYLMSDASSYHTGDTFLIDGGYALF